MMLVRVTHRISVGISVHTTNKELAFPIAKYQEIEKHKQRYTQIDIQIIESEE